jgi:hypothetical protein
MTGETDLPTLLRAMQPVLWPAPYSFGLLPKGETFADAFALIHEAEGITVIAPLAALNAAGIAHQGPWSRISLTVHSALSAVGLTATVATALAQEGISANVVAGYYHDHVFVQADRDRDAMAVMTRLSS